MELAEKICDHICLINNGEVVLDGTMENVKKKYQEDTYIIEGESLSLLHKVNQVEILEENNTSYKIRIKNKNIDPTELVNKINKHAKVRKFELVEPALHDIFIKIIQEQNQYNK